MGSPRTPGSGEVIKSKEQSGEVVQEIGPLVWDGTNWQPVVQAHGAYEQQSHAGMAAVVPQMMNSVGQLVPFKTSGSGIDNDAGLNTPEMSQKLKNSAGNFDFQRNNLVNLEALKKEVRISTSSSSLIKNYNHSKLLLNLHVEKAGTGEITLSLIGEVHTVASFVPITGTLDLIAGISPGLTTSNGQNFEGKPPTTAMQTVGIPVPGQFTIKVTHSNSSEWEYYVYYSLLV